MKKISVFLKVFLVLSIVGTSLAFTKPKAFGLGQVYCHVSCLNSFKINWKRDPTLVSQVTDPCENGPGNEYFIGAQGCQEYPLGTTYINTPDGK